MWHVYILECSDGSFYTGVADNLEKRIKKHNSSKGAVYTKRRLPVKLIYKERHLTKLRAFERERQIKGWSKAKKSAVIKADKQTLINLSCSRD